MTPHDSLAAMRGRSGIGWDRNSSRGTELTYGNLFSTRATALIGGLSMLAVACTSAQVPQQAEHNIVPLVSDTCPTVHIGDKISFDLNPLFDPIWPVTGLRNFGLTFAAVAEDGVHLRSRGIRMGSRGTSASSSALDNGFFHVEVTVGPRNIAPGVYRLVNAFATAEVVPEYAEKPPQMTRSPVDERYCITVADRPALQSPQSGG